MATACIVFGLTGCVASKTWVPTGGSRADGVVRLSYEVGSFEKPEVSEAQGLAAATERCAAWGYESAEAFGGQVQECITGNCSLARITKEYQCLGHLEAPHSSKN